MFPATDAIHLEVYVNVAGQLRVTAYLDTDTIFRYRILHFTAPGYEGFIDEETGQGRPPWPPSWRCTPVAGTMI